MAANTAKSDKYGDAWEKYRPNVGINFSDVIEDKTIYDTSQASKSTFEPNEITGRSTSWVSTDSKYRAQSEIDVNALSVDDILGSSFVENIRHMSQNKHIQTNGSLSIGIPHKYTSTTSLACDNLNWNQSVASSNAQVSESMKSEQFRPFDEMGEELLKDEKEWQNEFADIPYDTNNCDRASSIKAKGNAKAASAKVVNLTEFSGILDDSTPVESSTSEMSIGRYFSRKCEDIRNVIPNNSPTKARPIPLLSNSFRSGFNTSSSTDGSRHSKDDELRIKTLKPIVNNATYDRNNSVMSISSIAAHLKECASPRTILTELVSKTSKKAGVAFNANNIGTFDHIRQPSKPLPKDTTPNDEPMSYETMPEPFPNTDRGMLNRMNSTRFNEKENQWRHNDNTANTIENESITDETDVSSFSYRPGSSVTQTPNHNERNSVAGRSVKRMRSPDQNNLEIELDNLRLDSPTRDTAPMAMVRQCNSGLDKPVSELRNYGNRAQLSPIGGMNHSLPNLLATPNSQSTPNAVIVRSISQCSTNSEFTQNDGKFPLKANMSELTWECVKLRKSVIKSFVVKNASEKKLSLKMEVLGPGFQIASSGTEKEWVTLQGNECRTIFIAFCPTMIGKAIGKVVFRPTRQWSEETERLINLWAFGGNTALQLRGIERAPVGISFLKMGETGNIRSSQLQRTFTIYNKGPLNGIATIFVKPKNNQYSKESHIQIEPSKCVIRPDSTADITVSYKLRRKDLEKLKSCEVLTVGTLEVITGAEPNRLRIASILKRDSGIQSYEQLEFLVNEFPIAANDRFDDFRENVDKIPDLFGCFRTSEIALTINSTALDETRENCSDLSIDETVMFRTIIETGKDDDDDDDDDPSSHGSRSKDTWAVSPTQLFMDTSNNSCKTITIRSFFKMPQTFQIDSNNRGIFNFSKASGYIRPGGECTINVELKRNEPISSYESAIIAIYIERDSLEIPVQIRPTPIFTH